MPSGTKTQQQKQCSSGQNQGNQNAITHVSARRSFQYLTVSSLVELALAGLLFAIRSVRIVSTIGSWCVHGLRKGCVLGLGNRCGRRLGCWCICRFGLLVVVVVIVVVIIVVVVTGVREGAEFASLPAHGHCIAEAEEGALLLLATLEHEVAAL
jgi:hypothetical protein